MHTVQENNYHIIISIYLHFLQDITMFFFQETSRCILCPLSRKPFQRSLRDHNVIMLKWRNAEPEISRDIQRALHIWNDQLSSGFQAKLDINNVFFPIQKPLQDHFCVNEMDMFHEELELPVQQKVATQVRSGNHQLVLRKKHIN